MSSGGLGKVKRESNFKRFRNRWKRRGLLEIDESHSKYVFTSYIKEGLENVVPVTKDDDAYQKINNGNNYDTKSKTVVECSFKNQKFEFTSYAAEIFLKIRQQLGYNNSVYLATLKDGNFFEFISNSKSGQIFFVTQDKQFIIKTQTKKEKDFCMKILHRYVNHFERFPHSLLVKYLGFYKINLPKHQNVYFSVMQSVLYPDERILERYDLKGCEAGRYTPLSDTTAQTSIAVLKDLNLGEKLLDLGGQRLWFLRQIEIDVEFLNNLMIIDYSLLVGFHGLQNDEKRHIDGLADVICRTTKSISRDQSVVSPTKPQKQVLLVKSVSEDTSTSLEETELSTSPPLTESETISQNRRLLPMNRNELHVLNGDSERYYLGIIDIFTTYGTKKRLEGFYKKLHYSSSKKSYSTVHPEKYSSRFYDFLSKRTK